MTEQIEVTIPEAAMPVVEILRREAPKPTAPLIRDSGRARFECGKCPMGLLPTALTDNPEDVSEFTDGTAMAFLDNDCIGAFWEWWDDLTLAQARKAIDLIWPVLLILICSISVSAQSPTQEKRTETPQASTGGRIVLPKQKRLRFDYGDLVYLAGSVADVASSVGQHESNPVLKNARGNFSVGKGLALKSGVYAAIKTVGYFYPDRPKATMWFKAGVGIAWGAVAVHNVRARR